jgi:hypothetical protein
LESAEYLRNAAIGNYDLVIYDQCVPDQMPRANTLFVGRLPPVTAWRTDKVAGRLDGEQDAAVSPVFGPQIVDWDRAHPLLAHVELGEVQIADSLLTYPRTAGGVLIESTAGPIAAIASRDSYQDVVLGFEIVGSADDGSQSANTNWPVRPSFPTFWLNVVEHLAARSEEQEAAAVRPGRPFALRGPAGVDQLTVAAPNGDSTSITRSDKDVFQFAGTNEAGVYRVRQGDHVVQRFAVNLFDRAESDVRVKPSQDPESQTLRPADIRIGHVDIAASADRAPARREMWKALLACALVVLVLEWYIYNRKVYL